MECLNCLVPGLAGDEEFGKLDYGPMRLADIRRRQEWPSEVMTSPLTIEGEAYRLRYSFVKQRGYYADDPEKANQDSMAILPNLSETVPFAVGVFDGHGEYGDDCSGSVADNIGAELAQGAQRGHAQDIPAALRATYSSLNATLHASDDFDDEVSGTTAVTLIFADGMLWTANVGDSRAIIAQSSNDGSLVPRALSNDHSPFDKLERARIRRQGGEIASVRQRRNGEMVPDDFWDVDLTNRDLAQKFPAPRVWSADRSVEGPACAFTRSLGDAMGERLGVISEPEITCKELRKHDRFVCVASDGVWEFLSNEDVCAIVQRFDEPLAACRAVVAEAYRLWMKYDGRGTDDITIVLLFIEPASGDANGAAPSSPGVPRITRGRGDSFRTVSA